MSAKAAPIPPVSPVRRPRGKQKLSVWAGSAVAAAGLGLLLAGASASDVAHLSDALGAPVETSPLPAHG